MSWWVRRWPTAAAPRSRTWSAVSSIHWCCAPICRAIPRRAGFSPACAKCVWTPLRTRTCPSSGWWRSCGPSATFEYASELFEESTIARMATHWRLLLEGMIASPERCVWELPLLSEAEGRQLLTEWNQTAVEYQRDSCVHELFEAQAERTPQAIAVRFEG